MKTLLNIANKYPFTNITIFKYFFALILFFNASYIQYNIHLTLAKLNRSQYEIYPIPNSYWIFCPNNIAEIFIYIAFAI